MPKPKTATLKLEIVNDDGSKTIVTTANLDATKLPERGNTADWQDHIELGMRDPYYDPDDFNDRRNRWVNDTLCIAPRDSHFYLKLQLPPVHQSKHVYQIQEIEAPDTSVVMTTDGRGSRMIPCNFDEKTAAKKAEEFGTSGPFAPIYFILDIP